MKRFEPFYPLRHDRHVVRYLNHLAEAVERLEKKVEFIMENAGHYTVFEQKDSGLITREGTLKDLYESTQDHE